MKYNPEKMYSWNPDETFNISGREFGLILNTIRTILSTEQAQHILLANKTNEILEKIMEENVKSGKIIEKIQQNGKEEKKLDTGSGEG